MSSLSSCCTEVRGPAGGRRPGRGRGRPGLLLGVHPRLETARARGTVDNRLLLHYFTLIFVSIECQAAGSEVTKLYFYPFCAAAVARTAESRVGTAGTLCCDYFQTNAMRKLYFDKYLVTHFGLVVRILRNISVDNRSIRLSPARVRSAEWLRPGADLRHPVGLLAAPHSAITPYTSHTPDSLAGHSLNYLKRFPLGKYNIHICYRIFLFFNTERF